MAMIEGVLKPWLQHEDLLHRCARIPLICAATLRISGHVQRHSKLGADIVTHYAARWIGGPGTGVGGIVIDGGLDVADGYHGTSFWDACGSRALSAKLRMGAMRDVAPSAEQDSSTPGYSSWVRRRHTGAELVRT
ncbi:hypothetical protein B2J93_9265 [Marssonina coronariae]|uniref:Uncharacterized protein n=1 Tax=Diplocarpon coronariae TaxID=2795749 RepID=A0A218ZFG6_9HELO|nr:hypothetical protein B2J93_9265 [Marssonina coronariae]